MSKNEIATLDASLNKEAEIYKELKNSQIGGKDFYQSKVYMWKYAKMILWMSITKVGEWLNLKSKMKR